MFKKRALAIFLLILLAGCILRLYKLGSPDINGDEFHYINDAVRLLHQDPYISIRHHPFYHPAPSIGHPFLAQIISSGFFKVFGISTFTARLPYAIFGLLTALLIPLFNKSLGGKVSFLAFIIYSISPFSVMFSRDAHLDSIFAFFITLTALSIWRFRTSNNKSWLILAGIACSLAISTKLDGIIALVMAITFLFVKEGPISGWFNKVHLKNAFTQAMVVIAFTIPVSILLNDPSAYLNGILHPADPSYNFGAITFWMNILRSFPFLILVLFYLLTPLVLIIWFISVFLILKSNAFAAKFILIWQVVLFSLFVFHTPGVSGVWGMSALIVPIILGVSYYINILNTRLQKWLTILILLTSLPFTVLYGLHLTHLPYIGASSSFNRLLGDNFYQEVINKLNVITPRGGRVFLLPQADYPVFALRPDISWTYSDFRSANVLVVISPELVSNISNISYLTTLNSYQDGGVITRYVFIKN